VKDPECDSVDEFVDYVMRLYYKYKNISKPLIAREMMYINMLGVHPDFSKRGIGFNLIRKSIEHGKALGFSIIWSFTTSPHSAHIFHKNTFSQLFEVEYKNYLCPLKNSYCFANSRYQHCTVFEYIPQK